jgi:hypothetical protein
MALKKEFPDLIAGFDLVAQEDTNNPLIYYIESLLWFQQETKNRGLDIPFIFHAVCIVLIVACACTSEFYRARRWTTEVRQTATCMTHCCSEQSELGMGERKENTWNPGANCKQILIGQAPGADENVQGARSSN